MCVCVSFPSHCVQLLALFCSLQGEICWLDMSWTILIHSLCSLKTSSLDPQCAVWKLWPVNMAAKLKKRDVSAHADSVKQAFRVIGGLLSRSHLHSLDKDGLFDPPTPPTWPKHSPGSRFEWLSVNKWQTTNYCWHWKWKSCSSYHEFLLLDIQWWGWALLCRHL